MSWEFEMDQVRRMRALGKRMGGAEGIERQKSQGRQTVRERIDGLLDAGSFEEVGTTHGVSAFDDEGAVTSFRPGSSVRGFGRIDGRPSLLTGQDFTIRGGAADGMVNWRSRGSTQLAEEFRLPFVKLLDGLMAFSRC